MIRLDRKINTVLCASFFAWLAISPGASAQTFTGLSSGDGGRCFTMSFEVSVNAGRITGNMNPTGMRGSGPSSVEGTVDGAGVVALATQRQGGTGDPRLQRTEWNGKLEGNTMTLRQKASALCATPRTVVLQRR